MPSKRKIKDHDDCLKLVCFFGPHKATNKGWNRSLNPAKEFICNHVYEKYEQFESIFPSGYCDKCSTYVTDMVANGELSNKPLPDPYEDYDQLLKELQSIPKSTRSKRVCNCRICKIVKENPFFPKKSIKKSKEVKKCLVCKAVLGPGKKHKNCGRKEHVNKLMTEVTPKTRMKLAIETIKEAQSKKESDSPLRVSRLSGGPSMPIVIGQEAVQPSTS